MQPSFYNYSPEKKQKGGSSLYLRVIFFGVLAAIVLIAGGKGLAFIISFFIKRWVWLLAIVFAIIFIRKFISTRGRR